MKTLYATSFYLLFTGLTFVSCSQNNIQSSKFIKKPKCMFALSSASNSAVSLTDCVFDNRNNANQFWEISPSDTDFAQIQLSGTNLCLDSSLTIQPCPFNRESQLFLFTSNGLIKVNDSGKCVVASSDADLDTGECNSVDQKTFWIPS